jgi:hypothetical protein
MPNPSFLVRVGVAVALGFLSHLLDWGWLCGATSEAILRTSSFLGFASHRLTFDTITIQGRYFQFEASCTFIDVVVGSLPLVWSGKSTLSKNLLCIAATSGALFLFNIVRLEIGQILYAFGAAWVIADSILGGVSYFAVWLVLINRYNKNSSIGQSRVAGEDASRRTPEDEPLLASRTQP